ncbi:UNVERIFIED_CONTAM: hypothetical protein Scaly_3020100 [Sesamum calycinum]|uniref:Uncharacterized protein n=1 Tax=Sesamum calycinum TaxID=2727403 RepID=A0AAW2K7G2_9LAMI
MLSRPSLTWSRNGSFRAENLGQNALAMIGNLCFTLFVVGVLVFTIIAATYQPEDPLFHPSSKITTFLTSDSNATFKTDIAVVKTGEDFVASNQTAFDTFINITDVDSAVVSTEPEEVEAVAETRDCRIDDPINCRDPDVFHLLMRSAIEKFKEHHFYRFGKPVRGNNDSSCHMAWRFRPKEGKAAAFYKDYRSFTVVRSENCTLSVAGIGDYHSGGNARKRRGRGRGKNREKDREGFEKVPAKMADNPIALPEVGETVNDALPTVESESSFSQGKYLLYSGGGDRCKSMNQYLWSFMCMLGEAQYLNRTLVMDLSMCLSKIYTSSGQDEEGKDFRFYFDFEHLMDSAPVLEQNQFWSEWSKWQKKDGLSLHLVEDFRVTPMKLADSKDTLIMRKFGSVEPDTTVPLSRQENGWKNFGSRDDLWDSNSDWYAEMTKLNNGNPVEFDGYMRISVDTEVFLRGKKQIETFNELTKDCKDGINTCTSAS